MSENRVHTSSNLHLDGHPEAAFSVRNIGRIGSQEEPTFALDFRGNGSWTDATVFLTWAQLRQLRHALSVGIEAGLIEATGAELKSSDFPRVPGTEPTIELTSDGRWWRITSADGLHTLHSSAPTREAALEEFQDWELEGFTAEDVSLDEAVQRG